MINALWDIAWDGSMLGDDDDDPMSANGTFVYQAVLLLAPFFYLLEAIFDISIVARIRTDSILFGVGAMFELLAAILSQSGLAYDGPSHIITLISTHAYILNVMVLLLMDRHQQGMIYCGNIIFGIGASIDVILSYGFHWNPLWLDYGNLVSALCWLVDALVYIAAEKVQESTDDSSEDSSISSSGLHEENTALGTPLLPLSTDVMEQASENSNGSSIRHRIIGPQPTYVGNPLIPIHLV